MFLSHLPSSQQSSLGLLFAKHLLNLFLLYTLIQTSASVCVLSHFSHVQLCDPMDCTLPGSSVHGESPGKNTRVGCCALLQGIFPTQGLYPGLLHSKQILYQLSYQGSPIMDLVMTETILEVAKATTVLAVTTAKLHILDP